MMNKVAIAALLSCLAVVVIGNIIIGIYPL